MPTFRQDTKIGGMVPMMKTDDINDQAITKDKIRDGNVTTEKLADGAVSTDKLPDGAIKTPKIEDGNITTSKLAEASVVTSKIADQNVTKEKIADQSVDNSKLSPSAVTYDKVKDKAIITEKLNDRAVTTEKVEEKAITNPKLGDQSVDGRVVREASIESKHIGNNAVSTPKIASRSVTNEKIAYNSVSRAELTTDVRNSIDKKADAEQVNNSLYNLEKKIGDRFVIEGDVTNLPDEEDLTSVKESERYVLKLADRSYAPEKFSGKGYKILRRNIKPVSIAVTKIQIETVPSADGTLSFTVNGKETQVAVSATTDNTTTLLSQKVASAFQESMTEYEVSVDDSLITLTRKSDGSVTSSVFSASTTGVLCTILDSTKRDLRNILTPAMINQPNTIYEIRYDFDLNGKELILPDNCILEFKGGTISNGTISNLQQSQILYPENFNIFPNDKSKDISEIIKLVAKNGCILKLNVGTYYCSETTVTSLKGFIIEGVEIPYTKSKSIIENYNSKQRWVIKLGGTDTFDYSLDYNLRKCANVTIKNVSFITYELMDSNITLKDTQINTTATLILDNALNCKIICGFNDIRTTALSIFNSWECYFDIAIYGCYTENSAIFLAYANSSGAEHGNISAMIFENIKAERLVGSLLETGFYSNTVDVVINNISCEIIPSIYEYVKSVNSLSSIIDDNYQLQDLQVNNETVQLYFRPLIKIGSVWNFTINNIVLNNFANSIMFDTNSKRYFTDGLLQLIKYGKITINNIVGGNTSYIKIDNSTDYTYQDRQLILNNLNLFGDNMLIPLDINNLNTLDSKYNTFVSINKNSNVIINPKEKINLGYSNEMDYNDIYANLFNFKRKNNNIIKTTDNGNNYVTILGSIGESKPVIIPVNSVVTIVGFNYKLNLYNNEDTLIREVTPKPLYNINNKLIFSKFVFTETDSVKYFKIKYTNNTIISSIKVGIESDISTWYSNLQLDRTYYYINYIHCYSLNVTDNLVCNNSLILHTNCIGDGTLKLQNNARIRNIKYLQNVKLTGNYIIEDKLIGSSEQRPVYKYVGLQYYDTTIKKMIVWEGTKWVNLDGTELAASTSNEQGAENPS